ncbi:MAG: orotidine-5'-phosphate decarboxylase [Bacteroidales bacterium]|nr:MAG: orotidine-5'-phosphate decarboxylase [Bacteroidales bacterium]
MNCKQLFLNIKNKKSFLCIGLDTDIQKIPSFLLKYKNPEFEFNKLVVDATARYVIAYKPNIAFYESNGPDGWRSLELTISYIKKKYPDIFLIADAKRGDIENTSRMYAKTFFDTIEFDAVTVSPYMGKDSLLPFLKYKDKWIAVLALTSNQGAEDFQFLNTRQNERIFETIIRRSKDWGSINNIMYVVGATKASILAMIREIIPDHFILVPGIGAQGGSLKEVVKYGKNKNLGLIVNSSRSIIYADNTELFAETAGSKAKETQNEMNILLKQNNII